MRLTIKTIDDLRELMNRVYIAEGGFDRFVEMDAAYINKEMLLKDIAEHFHNDRRQIRRWRRVLHPNEVLRG